MIVMWIQKNVQDAKKKNHLLLSIFHLVTKTNKNAMCIQCVEEVVQSQALVAHADNVCMSTIKSGMQRIPNIGKSMKSLAELQNIANCVCKNIICAYMELHQKCERLNFQSKISYVPFVNNCAIVENRWHKIITTKQEKIVDYYVDTVIVASECSKIVQNFFSRLSNISCVGNDNLEIKFQ